MSSSSSIIILPSGTSEPINISIPTVGGWLGGVVVAFSSSASFTLNSLSAIKFPQDTNLGSRTLATSLSIAADRRKHYTLRKNESILKLVYTATKSVSVSIETDRLYLLSYINLPSGIHI